MQQPQPRPPLIAEIDQLRRSVDSMNSQAAEMLKNMDTLRNIGAPHIALPSTEQEKLDREWEYFETVCDQVFFILENTKYKLKRKQELLEQQLNPPPVQPVKEEASEVQTIPTTVTQAISEPGPATVAEVTATTSGDTPQPNSTPQAMTPGQATTMYSTSSPISTSTPMSLVGDPSSSLDVQMMSPPSSLGAHSTSSGTVAPTATPSSIISTASLLSASAPVPAPTPTTVVSTVDNSATLMMDDSLMSEEDKLGETMFDLGDIGNLGGEMDDMINF
ncbi:hypothetical protein BGZ83_005764 [Gryganskiella cystojenkinii]|nr:hypothetical protein BGZ83_005764 [Gryganskiella cystojenkinii]